MMFYLLGACSGENTKNIEDLAEIADFEDFWGDTEIVHSPRLHRLQHEQWKNAASSLLSFDATSYANTFVQQPLLDPFSQYREEYWVHPLLFHNYQIAAEQIARGVRLESEWYAEIVPQDAREGGVSFSPVWDSDELFEEEPILLGGESISFSVDIPYGAPYLFSVLVGLEDICLGQSALFQLKVDGEVKTESILNDTDLSIRVELEEGQSDIEFLFVHDCAQGFISIEEISASGWPDLGETRLDEEGIRIWLEAFTSSAFRRDLLDNEQEFWMDVFEQGAIEIASGDDIADGVEWVISAVLQSPHFLYRIEYSPDGEPLSKAELLTKLSFQICNKPPDAQMMEQIEREDFSRMYSEFLRDLLQQPCTKESLEKRHDQWMFLSTYANIFSEEDSWNPELNTLFQQEFRAFMQQLIFEEKGTVHDLYTADYTMANAEIAALYGEEAGDEFEKIQLNPEQRAGLLTMSGFLARDSDGGYPSPIHRGMVINWVFLCTELPNPPDSVSPLPDVEGEMTHRELVESYTGEGTCGESCHSIINPPGYALESFDVLGRWRTEDNGKPIDASGTFTFMDQGMVSWTSSVEFAQLLAQSREAHQCYVGNLFSFVHGREVEEEDEETIFVLTERSMRGRPILGLLHDLLMSNGFRYRGEQ
ncbi:MAG: hypothetical protein CL916_09765 [Deltaproteobacteria bacterium]|nr:hypothetical protein [Deltaproteobacteria bacterium]